jgi:hypothetical protein
MANAKDQIDRIAIATRIELGAKIAKIALRCPSCCKEVKELLIQSKDCDNVNGL